MILLFNIYLKKCSPLLNKHTVLTAIVLEFVDYLAGGNHQCRLVKCNAKSYVSPKDLDICSLSVPSMFNSCLSKVVKPV